jgi:xylulokinase
VDVLLGIDLGTTGCKAAVCSVEGEVLGTGYIEYPLVSPRPEVVEQDANLWWSLTQGAVGRFQVGGRAVRALSVSAQGISFVPVDQAGRPLRKAISWLDTRAAAEVEIVRQRISDEELFRVTGKRPGAFYVLPKLLWLREHEPRLYQDADRFLMALDYLLCKLCGAAVTDLTMASGSLLLDLWQLNWSADLLAAFDVRREQLPALAQAGTVAGTLAPDVASDLGLSPETLVVVGGQDQKCAALGAGIRPGRVTVSLGTATAISYLTDRPVLDPERRIPAFPFVVPGYWDLEGVVSTSGAALRWIRDAFFPTKGYAELMELASQSPPGANGVRFFPHLTGATSPLWEPGARGAFAGLSLATGAADIVRSVLEGVAFQIRSNVDVITSLAPVEAMTPSGTMTPSAEIVLFGGGARHPLWGELIAQVTGKPVYVTGMADVANWGACILAGVGAGLYRDSAVLEPIGPDGLGTALSRRTCSQGARLCCVPSPGHVRQYDELYRAYLEAEARWIGSSADGLWSAVGSRE